MSHFYPPPSTGGTVFWRAGGGVELEIKKQVFIILFVLFLPFFHPYLILASSLPHPYLILASSLPHPCFILFHSFSYSPILWLNKSFSNERFIMSRVVYAINIVLRYLWNLYIVQQVIVVFLSEKFIPHFYSKFRDLGVEKFLICSEANK